MRKRLLIFVILIALAIGGLPWIHGAIDDKKDEVDIYEEVYGGDPSAANGLTVNTLTHMDQRLLWETVIRPGSGADPETTFEFFGDRKLMVYYGESHLQLMFAGGNYGFGGTFSMEEMADQSFSAKSSSFASHAQGLIWKPAVDVAKRAPKGWEEYTEVVRLKDYYDVYPMTLSMYLNEPDPEHPVWVEEESTKDEQILSEFFQVPVPEDVELKVTIVKDEYGNVTDVDCCYTEETARNHPYLFGDAFFNSNVLTKEGGYLSLSRNKRNAENIDSTVLDSPRLKEDYGIYFFPLVEYTEDDGVIFDGYNPQRIGDLSQLSNVYPLEEGVNALKLTLDEEDDRLILLTEEAGKLWATILQRETMTPLQKVDLGTIGSTETIDKVFLEGDMMLVTLQDQDGAMRLVFLYEDSGIWTKELQSSMNLSEQDENPWLYALSEFTQMAWDGERLAIVQWERYHSCAVYVMICAEDELKYVGAYRRGDTPGAVRDYERMIQPWQTSEGLTVAWE